MHTREASSQAKNRRGTSKTSGHRPIHMIKNTCITLKLARLQPVTHETIMCSLSFSYKVPAKGDGVDYVRTEDEVCR